MNRRIFFQAVLQPTVAGEAVDHDAQIYWARVEDQWAAWEGSTPLTLLALTFEEGVDYPFYSRAEWGDQEVRNRRRKKWQQARVSMLASYEGSMPTGPFVQPPSTDPLFVGKSQEHPFERFKKRRQVATWLAGHVDLGVPLPSLPAATYSDTICRLLSEIQRHMLENTIDEGVTWSLWTETEVRELIIQRMVRFMMETGLIRERRAISATAGVSEYDYPSDTVDVRRATWDSGSSTTASVSLYPTATGFYNAFGLSAADAADFSTVTSASVVGPFDDANQTYTLGNLPAEATGVVSVTPVAVVSIDIQPPS